jgi:hypothetical protein
MKFLAPVLAALLVCLGALFGAMLAEINAPMPVDLGLIEPVLTDEPRVMRCDEGSHDTALEYGCACMVTKPGGEPVCLFFPRHNRVAL